MNVDSLIIAGDNYHIYGKGGGTNLGLTGNPAPFFGLNLQNLYCPGTNIVLDTGMNIILYNTNTITNNPGSTLHIQSVLTGTGGWDFQGLGTMYLDGTNSDSSTGTCEVDAGTLVLDRFSSNGQFSPSFAISSLLVIGTTNLAVPALVSESGVSDEFGAFVTDGFYYPSVTIMPSGTLQINGASDIKYDTPGEEIGSLNMTGGVVSLQGLAQGEGTNYGQLEVHGSITVFPSATTSYITGHGLGWLDLYGGEVDQEDFQSAALSFYGGTNVIDVMENSVLFIDTPLTTDFYAGGLQKDEAWRREWCERASLGFSVVSLVSQKVVEIESAKVA